MERETSDPAQTTDSVERTEDEPANPITEDARLTEPGKGFRPGTPDDTDPNDLDEGPAAQRQQMPR